MSLARAAWLAGCLGMVGCGGGKVASDATSETGDAASGADATDDVPAVDEGAQLDVATPDVAPDTVSEVDGGADAAVDVSPDVADAHDAAPSGDGGVVNDGAVVSDGPVNDGTTASDGALLTCLPIADAGAPPDAGLTLVADSHFGFSSTQHGCSWSYGYETPSTDGGFTPLPTWDDADQDWVVLLGTYWTVIGADLQVPNGTTTTYARAPIEQWAVRRWTSTVQGAVTISGVVRKDGAGQGGNGIDARILVDGTVAYSHFVDGLDTNGVSFSIDATVSVGSHVDFVLDPHLSDDIFDATDFVVHIWH